MKLMFLFLKLVPAKFLHKLITSISTHKAVSLPPDEGLRFLFNIDASLYPVEGQPAVAYDGGIHTKHRHISLHSPY